MNSDERNEQISKFLECFDSMLQEANKIEGFTYQISVTISSDNQYLESRVCAINEINKLFTKNNMNWTSSN